MKIFNSMINLYDEDGNIININKNNLVDGGICGKIYIYNNDEMVKLFKKNFIPYANMKMMKKFSELKLKNFYEIRKLLLNKDNRFVGYTMKKYKSSDIDLIMEPIDYLIESVINLYETISIISNMGIIMYDFTPSNSIISDEGIIIIDADLYEYEYFGSNKNINLGILSDGVLYRMYIDYLYSIHRSLYTKENCDCLNRLFKHISDIDCFYNEVRYSKNIADYLVKKRIK